MQTAARRGWRETSGKVGWLKVVGVLGSRPKAALVSKDAVQAAAVALAALKYWLTAGCATLPSHGRSIVKEQQKRIQGQVAANSVT